MIKKTDFTETEKLLEVINTAIAEKKGIDLINIDLKGISNSVTKYFVICHANSNTHVNTIADNIQRLVKTDLHEKPWQKEGLENSQWVLLDYVDIVVHVFQKEYREFYRLEDLWADGIIKKIETPE